jgi:hypothetical protein
MIRAHFEHLLDAAIYRHNHGGWLFVQDTHGIGPTIYSPAQWFSAGHFTASTIMLAVKGSGHLICDDRFLTR